MHAVKAFVLYCILPEFIVIEHKMLFVLIVVNPLYLVRRL
jgi:hypothetical protein